MKCPPGFLFDSFFQKCSNPQGTFILNGMPENCHQDCRSCDGPSGSSCLSCYSPSVLNQASKKCEFDCLQGFYKDSDFYCQKCHDSCKNCAGPLPTNCLSCADEISLKTGEGVCESCGNENNRNESRCQFLTALSGLQPSTNDDRDIYSSVSLELLVKNQGRYKEMIAQLKSEDLNVLLEVALVCID